MPGFGTPPPPEETPLMPLREDLQLLEGKDPQGRNCRRIYDPSSGRYFMTDDGTMRILSFWKLGTAGKAAEAATLSAGRPVAVEDVLVVLQFLRNNFLVQETGAGKTRFMAVASRSKNSLKNLAAKYLYIKIPMLHPDRFLDVVYPFVRPFFTPAFWWLALVSSVISFVLILRQWDVFIGTIPDFFRFDGMLVYGFVLGVSKTLHEFAHALTVRHYGLRVPSMGVVILVLFPLLYTDATESWRSANPRVRMNISAAGIVAELVLAAAASIGWLVCDEGPWKSACFVLATVNWVTTLFFNMNPLMRFDGYFILADALGIENLQTRAFAQLKHFFAWHLLRIDLPAEKFAPAMRTFMCWFGAATFAYRLTVISSISLLVYHYFFKVLGILLFVHQIYKSVCMPLKKAFLWGKKNRSRARPTAWLWLLALTVGGGFGLCFMPLSQSVGAQAQYLSEARTTLHAFEPGIVVLAPESSRTHVRKGELLYELASPELEREKESAKLQINRLQAQLAVNGFDDEQAQERIVNIEELKRSKTRLANALARDEKLKVFSPMDGRIDWLDEPVKAGEWVGHDMELADIDDPSKARIVAYVSELDRRRIAPGSMAWFYPKGTDTVRVRARITEISDYAASELPEKGFASVYGGEIAVDSARDGKPLEAFYRVELKPEGSSASTYEKMGRVRIEARSEAPLAWLWRKLAGIWVRESVF